MSLFRDEKPWSPREIETLKRHVAEAKRSANEIAEDMGRSRNSVIGQVHRLGLRLTANRPPIRRNRVTPTIVDDIGNVFLNGEPLQFAEVDRPCARCAVRETEHHKHGCGQFAAEVRVRIK